MFINSENAQKIVCELSSVINRDINIIDRNGVILASTDAGRIGTVHGGALELIANKLPVLIVYSDNPAEGMKKGINLPIVIDGCTEGIIGITGEPDEVIGFGRVIKKMTEIMVQSVSRQEIADTVEDARSIFTVKWISEENPEIGKFKSSAALLNIDLSCARCIIYMKSENAGEIKIAEILKFVRRRISYERQNMCICTDGGIAIVLKYTDRNSIRQLILNISAEIEHSFGIALRCGVSAVAESVLSLKKNYDEARTSYVIAVGTAKNYIFYNENSPAFIVQCIPEQVRKSISSRAFHTVSEEEADLLKETIHQYFVWNGCIEAVAEAMHVHVNTVYYRLNQVRKVTGYDIKNPNDTLLLYISAYS